jgi:hypothetical protein
VMELQDKKLLGEMNSTKEAYKIQKELFEEKKAREEDLKEELVVEKANLDVYKGQLEETKKDKEQLLKETQNDEAKYQELLSKARAELEAMQSIVESIDFSDGDEVKEGDAIAIMGNSGYPSCSTGPHLHFEVRKNGSVQNAENYLEPKTLYVYDYDSGTKRIGSGSWEWPMKNPTVNQRYGKTPWSWWYPSGWHDGVDMESSNKYIYAPADGILVKGGMGCYGSTINYAAIDHGNGVVSYYLHIQ